MGRPPIVAAKAEATARLIENHLDEFIDLTDKALAAAGWEKREVTVEKWTQITEGK